MNKLNIKPPPQPVGWWVLGAGGGYSTQFAMFKRPTDEQIKNHREMLGWEWKEAPTTWKCPIDKPGCTSNCGSYSCGN